MSPTNAASSPGPSPEAVAGSTILVVDDETDILESLADLFAAALNVRVLTATSSDAALQLLGQERVDVLLSDFKMQGGDGLQLLEKAHALAPAVPRMLMTAFPDLELAIAAINDARIEKFFTKPLDPDKLVAIMRHALDARQARGRRDGDDGRALDIARRHAPKSS